MVTANWTKERTERLINEVAKIYHKKGSPKSMKASDWTKVSEAFNKKEKEPYDKNQLQNRLNTLKAQFRSYDMVVNLSGGGLDQRLDSSAWEALVQKHAECSQWKDVNFEFYDALKDMFCGKFATGSEIITMSDIMDSNNLRDNCAEMIGLEPATPTPPKITPKEVSPRKTPKQGTPRKAPKKIRTADSLNKMSEAILKFVESKMSSNGLNEHASNDAILSIESMLTNPSDRRKATRHFLQNETEARVFNRCVDLDDKWLYLKEELNILVENNQL
jgi:hypothetical protein